MNKPIACAVFVIHAVLPTDDCRKSIIDMHRYACACDEQVLCGDFLLNSTVTAFASTGLSFRCAVALQVINPSVDYFQALGMLRRVTRSFTGRAATHNLKLTVIHTSDSYSVKKEKHHVKTSIKKATQESTNDSGTDIVTQLSQYLKHHAAELAGNSTGI